MTARLRSIKRCTVLIFYQTRSSSGGPVSQTSSTLLLSVVFVGRVTFCDNQIATLPELSASLTAKLDSATWQTMQPLKVRRPPGPQKRLMAMLRDTTKNMIVGGSRRISWAQPIHGDLEAAEQNCL